ncbi:hypothetical protein ACHAQA_003250 [Verticillium albo-atrum]
MSSPHKDTATDSGPRYEIGSWTLGADGFDLGVRLNGKGFKIGIWADFFKDSPEASQGFQRAFTMMNEGNDQCTELWDYFEWVVGFFLPQFQAHAPPVVHTGKLTLADLDVQEVFECEFHVVQEEPIPGHVTQRMEEEVEDFDARTLQTSFPIIELADVEVPYDQTTDIFSIIPQRVVVGGRSCFYKLSASVESARNEIGKHDKIAASGLTPSDLSTSRLSAIVVASKGRLRGLIYDFIESEERLTWAIGESTPLGLKEKWASQIKDTVTKMHRLDVIWGDVKADNVLIDKDRNAVIIDLEGGITQGWVDHENEGTVRGDLQGLEKMTDFIFNDESPLRPRFWVRPTSLSSASEAMSALAV